MKNLKGKKVVKILLGILCGFVALVICWSRMGLALHFWNQITIGFLNSVIVFTLVSFKRFKKFIEENLKTRNSLTKMALIYTAIIMVLSWVLYFTNKDQKRVKSTWLNNRSCPNCFEKMINSQMTNLPIAFMTSGFYLGICLNFNKTLKSEEIKKLKNKLNFKEHILRLFVYLLASLPSILILVIFLIFGGNFDNINSESCFNFWVLSLFCVYTSFLTVYVAPVLNLRFGLGLQRDWICFDFLKVGELVENEENGFETGDVGMEKGESGANEGN